MKMWIIICSDLDGDLSEIVAITDDKSKIDGLIKKNEKKKAYDACRSYEFFKMKVS